MEKDFDAWNNQKKWIQKYGRQKSYREGEIWWCYSGTNIGSEQDGTSHRFPRPVLILKSITKNFCYILPLTTSLKEHSYNIPIGKIDGKEAMVILSQLRTIDTKRLSRKIQVIDPCMFLYVRENTRKLF